MSLVHVEHAGIRSSKKADGPFSFPASSHNPVDKLNLFASSLASWSSASRRKFRGYYFFHNFNGKGKVRGMGEAKGKGTGKESYEKASQYDSKGNVKEAFF